MQEKQKITDNNTHTQIVSYFENKPKKIVKRMEKTFYFFIKKKVK